VTARSACLPRLISPQEACEAITAHNGGGIPFSHFPGGVFPSQAAQAAGSTLQRFQNIKPPDQKLRDSAAEEWFNDVWRSTGRPRSHPSLHNKEPADGYKKGGNAAR